MIWLLGGLVAVAVVWWIVRRLIVLVLLVAMLMTTGVRLIDQGGSRLVPSVGGLQHEVSHDVTAVLRHDGAIHRR